MPTPRIVKHFQWLREERDVGTQSIGVNTKGASHKPQVGNLGGIARKFCHSSSQGLLRLQHRQGWLRGQKSIQMSFTAQTELCYHSLVLFCFP